MAGLGNRVRIVVHGALKNGRSGRYERSFVGQTVAQAIANLDSDDKERGCLPDGLCTLSPYSVNGEEESKYSDRVLQAGDVLTCEDP